MNPEERRKSEKQRREVAERDKGGVVEGSGRAIDGRKLDQMVSLRLDPEVLRRLRQIAKESDNGLSDLIRQAIVDWLESRETLHYSVWISQLESSIAGYDPRGLPNIKTRSGAREDESTGIRPSVTSGVS